MAGRPRVAPAAEVPPVVEAGSRGLSRTEQLFVALGAHVGMIAVAFGVFIVVVLGAAGSNGSDREVELAFLIPGLLWGATAVLIVALWLAPLRRTAWLIAPSGAWMIAAVAISIAYVQPTAGVAAPTHRRQAPAKASRTTSTLCTETGVLHTG
ncbi:MAG: hypothetical protein ACRDQC_15560 [Gaiellales bacterium]